MMKEKTVLLKFDGGDDESFEVELDYRNDVSTATVAVRNRYGAGSAHAVVLDIPFHKLMSAMLQLKEELS